MIALEVLLKLPEREPLWYNKQASCFNADFTTQITDLPNHIGFPISASLTIQIHMHRVEIARKHWTPIVNIKVSCHSGASWNTPERYTTEVFIKYGGSNTT